MFGVAALHFFANFGVDLVPETGEIAGDGQGATGGGEQMQLQGNLIAADARGCGEAKELLQLDGQERLLVAVVDLHLFAAWNLDPHGGQFVQLAKLATIEQLVQGGQQIKLFKLSGTVEAVQPGEQPGFGLLE